MIQLWYESKKNFKIILYTFDKCLELKSQPHEKRFAFHGNIQSPAFISSPRHGRWTLQEGQHRVHCASIQGGRSYTFHFGLYECHAVKWGGGGGVFPPKTSTR
jgi:hypothetical protein